MLTARATRLEWNFILSHTDKKIDDKIDYNCMVKKL